jgi:anti-sigma28 factor (negative regulator of flagellin synthesis)
MKITEKQPAHTDCREGMQNNEVESIRVDDAKVRKRGKSHKVDISREARKLQRVAELAHASDQLRANKVRQIKEQIEADQYHAESKAVAKSIARSEVSRLLNKKNSTC